MLFTTFILVPLLKKKKKGVGGQRSQERSKLFSTKQFLPADVFHNNKKEIV